MSKYNERVLSGSSYTKAHKITIDNEDSLQRITFHEEDVFILESGEKFKQQVFSVLTQDFTEENQSTEFDLLDPVTGLATGSTMTYSDLYVALYSLYFKMATDRDVAEEEARQQALLEQAAAEAAAAEQAAAETPVAPAPEGEVQVPPGDLVP